jgi:hypothetical protein
MFLPGPALELRVFAEYRTIELQAALYERATSPVPGPAEATTSDTSDAAEAPRGNQTHPAWLSPRVPKERRRK